jgi:toxin ParE1/3/4
MRTVRVSEDIMSVSDFKAQAAECLRRIVETDQPLVITQNGKAAGVLLSPREFDRLSERARFIACKSSKQDESMTSQRKKVATTGVSEESISELRLRWANRAEADLASIYEYIAEDDPIAAERWVEKLMERAKLAATAPLGGRIVPEFGVPELREVFVRSYRIVYRVRRDEIQVLTVFEGHQRFPSDVDLEGESG